MTTIIGLVIVFLAILFTISLVLSIINHIIQSRKVGMDFMNYSYVYERKIRMGLSIRIIIVSVLYTLIFYWYF